MDSTEIKKALYKENVTAIIVHDGQPGKRYMAVLKDGTEVLFVVPEAEITVRFDDAVPAKFLIRWLQK